MTTLDARQSDTTAEWRRRYNRMGYWYILPAVLLFVLMVAYPIGRAFYLSFFDYDMLEPARARFAGVANYVRLFTDVPNRGAFFNTVYFTVIFVPPYVILALIVAVMLNAVRRGSVFLRTMIFIPVVVSLGVASVMWMLFYDKEIGAVKSVVAGLDGWAVWLDAHLWTGFPWRCAIPAAPLDNAAWAMIGVAVVCLWNGIGINIILFLVGLQRIPHDVYEAARVDGAGPWQRFWHITLPQLRPTIYLVVLLSMIGAFKIFGQPYILTRGGPEDATLTYVMRLYKVGFQYAKMQFGYASSMAYALTLFIFAMSMFLRKLRRPVN